MRLVQDSLKLRTLWASERHCAFTDIIQHNGHWFCAFRDATDHMSYDGVVRILTSTDGVTWRASWVLNWQGADLRDPKFLAGPQNQLMLNTGVRSAIRVVCGCNTTTASWVLDADNQAWSTPILDASAHCTWRWMPTQVGDRFYVVGYSGKDRDGCLYASEDGINWQAWVKPFFPNLRIYSNEASLVCQGEKLICLLRRDKKGGYPAAVGSAYPPYSDWTWHELNQAIGGPKLINLSDDTLIAAYRVIDYEQMTAKIELAELNLAEKKLVPLFDLPSEGDCSYAGMVEHQGQLFISYYSTPENETAQIYLARLDIAQDV